MSSASPRQQLQLKLPVPQVTASSLCLALAAHQFDPGRELENPALENLFNNIMYCNSSFDATLFSFRPKASQMACEKEIWQKIGEGFVQEYYNQFDNTNRMALGNLYVSWFTIHFENATIHFCVHACNVNNLFFSLLMLVWHGKDHLFKEERPSQAN